MKTSIGTVFHSFGAAVCAGAVLLIASSAQAQNLFVANWADNDIIEITPSGVQSIFASGLDGPYGLAFNSAGDLFVANFFGGDIIEITPSGTQSIIASGLDNAYALAFNSAGDLFVSCVGGGASPIIEITPGGVKSTFAASSDAAGLAFDNAGDLFVASREYIFEYPPVGLKSLFASGLFVAGGLAFNNTGDLFVANWGDNDIIEITPSGVQSIFASGLDGPFGLAFDSAGDLIVTCDDSGKICEFINNGGTLSTNQVIFASGLHEPSGVAFQPVPELQGVATNDAFQLTVTMPSPYYSTIVQASSDLVNWCNIYTNMPPFTFTDPISSECPARFYRALLGP